MDKKEILKSKIEAYSEKPYNKYIVHRAKAELKELEGSKPEVVKKVKKLTKEELFDLKKDEQVKLLNKLGAEKIPRYEKQRVELLLKLQ